MTEFVYYLDRRNGIAVTDRQITIGDRCYSPAQIKGVTMGAERSPETLRLESYLRALSALLMLGSCGAKLLISPPAAAMQVLSFSMFALACSLVGILLLALMSKRQAAVVLKRADGATERLLVGEDTRLIRELVQALSDMARDYRAGRSPNNRGSVR